PSSGLGSSSASQGVPHATEEATPIRPRLTAVDAHEIVDHGAEVAKDRCPRGGSPEWTALADRKANGLRVVGDGQDAGDPQQLLDFVAGELLEVGIVAVEHDPQRMHQSLLGQRLAQEPQRLDRTDVLRPDDNYLVAGPQDLEFELVEGARQVEHGHV